jgi:hypothetical protein
MNEFCVFLDVKRGTVRIVSQNFIFSLEKEVEKIMIYPIVLGYENTISNYRENTQYWVEMK